MDIEMPDGTIIEGVPDGITKSQIMARFQKHQAKTVSEASPAAGEEKGFFGNVYEDMYKRGGQLADTVAAKNRGDIGGARAAFHKVGTEAGALGDIAGNIISSAGKTAVELLPESIKQPMAMVGSGVRQMQPYQKGVEAVEKGTEVWTGFKEKNPYLAKDIESAVNIGGLSVLGGGKAASKIGGKATESLRIPKLPEKPSALFEDISQRGIDEVGAFAELRKQLGSEAAKIQEEISGKFVNGKKVAPGLFDVAKERGVNAFIDGSDINNLAASIREQAKGEVGKDVISLLSDTASKLEDFLNQKPSLSMRGVIEKPQTSLNELETMRRSLSGLSKERTAAGNTAGRLVKQIDDMLDTARISGDTEAVDIWKQAISKRREFGRKFETPKEIAAAIGDEPNEVIEKMFLGFGPISSKRELSAVYDNTLKALPPEKRRGAEFLMKQAIINRMIKTAAQVTDAEEAISASRLSNQIRNLRRENQSIWNKFSESEKSELRRLEEQLRKSTQGGAINKIGGLLFRVLSRATRSNLELPRTIKPKTIFTIDELVNMTNIKPKFKERANIQPNKKR